MAKKGNIATRFDENGDICLDQAFLQQAGLKIPSEEKMAVTTIYCPTRVPQSHHYLTRSVRYYRFTTGDHSHRVGSHKRSNWWNSCAAKLLSDEQPCRDFLMGVRTTPRLHLKAGLILMTGCYAAISSLHKQMAHSVTRTRQPTFNVPLQILKHSCEQVKLTSIIACWKEPVFTVSKSH